MRALIAAFLLTLAISVGCSSQATRPRAARVVFDSTTYTTRDNRSYFALAVHNAGDGPAYFVRVFWHFNGDSIAQASLTEPPDLAKGESGTAATMPTSNVAWLAPTQPDSIEWFALPGAGLPEARR